MMIGLREKMDRALQEYREHSCDLTAQRVMEQIMRSAAMRDTWLVPLETTSENEFDKDTAEEIAQLGRIQTLVNNRGEEFYCAFTEPEKLFQQPKSMVSASYPVPQILKAVAEDESRRGLILNPWSDHFLLKKEWIPDLLETAGHVTSEETASWRSLWIPPRAVIDANIMMEEWDGCWTEEPSSEKWALHSYPIMPNGNILVAYVRSSTVYGGNTPSIEGEHIMNYYRVLEYEFDGKETRLINRYRFQLQDGHAGWIIVRNGTLYAAVTPIDQEDYRLLQLIPSDDDAQFSIYSHVNRVVALEDGGIAVGYENNLRDPAHLPFMLFDPEGDVAWRLRDSNRIVCSDITLDADSNVWYHLYPSDQIDMLDLATKKTVHHRVALQSFEAFALSDDKSKLFVSFDGYHSESSHYVLRADKEGNYVDPVYFEFRPTDSSGNVIRPENCDVYGVAATMRSIVILNADNRLFIYDVNDFCKERCSWNDV